MIIAIKFPNKCEYSTVSTKGAHRGDGEGRTGEMEKGRTGEMEKGRTGETEGDSGLFI